ncbi:acyl-CoA dehydrogenase family protein [Conexibacter sp. JD483]|uniref:acyl-CoA dehydrogenase family protein n=1 Tax=unclassified Conexibacter TaxID=2627773 RepID=UPI0027291D39|nr:MULTISPECIES: acyl-CoA dehydrogenase family protein [unclassified Conexibacter]MDO8184908.1 acyl-CoA dehydrogenase family protein [Conexibacter sp. CPCC 205706]MDO8198052.1 acyl-CoA dehydrogenase family protein [Conexibacter sp. CPCC 205762]MDR9372941.1 acyl-CoA dehydrogenase family protein [Conexibacter sp. JD483]
MTSTTPSGTTPRTHDDWLATARTVAAELASDALERDRANTLPHAQIDLFRSSGLLSLLVPAEQDGGGGDWRTAYQVIREIAAGDGSLGQLIGYHFQISWNAGFFANWELLAELSREGAAQGWFWGGAFNPRDADLKLTRTSGGYRLDGRKSFATGARVADRIGASAIDADTGEPRFIVLDPAQPGVRFGDDWDNLGQRLTASGSVSFDDVKVAPEGVVASLAPEALAPFGTLVTPAIQLVFIQFYIGIAEGALARAREYTLARTRPWLLSGVDAAAEDPYILQTYGELVAHLKAARALADEGIEALAQTIEAGPDALTWEGRGELAELVAAAKVVATRASLEATSRIFELTGARATSNAVGLDIHWRNVRTHTLHDPVAYKQREVGAHFLTGEHPPFTLYT